jgi:hypothetical protein
MLPWKTKLLIALLVDGVDLLVGWIPIAGEVLDAFQTAIAYALFGPIGLAHLWELLALGPIDWVPTMTILAWMTRGN